LIPVLELINFSVAFADTVVLDRINLSLPPVGMSVLMGPSGGGKSTLIRTLSGANDGQVALRSAGSVTIDGVCYLDIVAVPPEVRPGLVRQNIRFLIDTVRENLVGALPNRRSLQRGQQDEIIVRHLESLGFGSLRDKLSLSAADLSIVEQRLLALARVTLTNPQVVFADEPTADLNDREADLVLSALRRQAAERSVLFVTHNQGHARRAGGTTVLLAFGSVVASALSETFFDAPPNELARMYVKTGGCTRLPESGQPEASVGAGLTLPPELAPEHASRHPAEPSSGGGEESMIPASEGTRSSGDRSSGPYEAMARGPRRFFWVIRGQLGGLPRPGVFEELDSDLDGLERVRVSTLVTLEEWESVPRTEVETRGLELIYFPIPDMGAPDLRMARALCERIESRLAHGGRVAFHCRAGNGRTGTMLAAQLVYRGVAACDALERVRSVNPKAVESDAQLKFLEEFELDLKVQAPHSAN
jgi:atypical dual specificity phosphatase